MSSAAAPLPLELDSDEIAFLTKIFSEEALEILQDIDPLLLGLESGQTDPKLVDTIYRKIHTVKGGSGVTPKAAFIGKLCHEFESCLNAVKKGRLRVDAGAVNLFLASADLARTLGIVLRDGTAMQARWTTLADELIAGLKVLHEGAAALPETGAGRDIGLKAKGADVADLSFSEEEGVFVANARLDDFVSLSGEFIIFKNNFDLFCHDHRADSEEVQTRKLLKGFSHRINKLTGRLQDQIMDVRKVLLSRAFGKLPRMVRQTGQELGKRVKLVQTGLDMGVDKSVSKALAGAMTHMVRNSLDHGMETPAERASLGKPEEGSIYLSAAETRGVITVILRDDGRGINKARVVAKALAQDLITAAAAPLLEAQDIFNLLFLPGFSTAEAVTDVSGRGVGMDAVRAAIEDLHGAIDIQSTEGIGTTITCHIPAPKTVVIEKTVVVQCGDFFFAVPTQTIAKIDSSSAFPLTHIGGQCMSQFNGATIRVGRYADYAAPSSRHHPEQVRSPLDSLYAEAPVMVIIQHKTARIGLLVDAVKSQMEAVVRPFDGITRHVHGCKGTSVIGFDQIAYVLSAEELVGGAAASAPA